MSATVVYDSLLEEKAHNFLNAKDSITMITTLQEIQVVAKPPKSPVAEKEEILAELVK